MSLRAALGVCATLAMSVPLMAQQASPVVKIDVYVGIGGSYGGRTAHDVSESFAGGALVTTPMRRATDSRRVVGFGVYAHAPLDFGTSCLVIIGTSGCIPRYPSFTVGTAFFGWDTGRGRKASGFRALVGPSLVRADSVNSLSRVKKPMNTVFGLQGRLDASVQPVRHLGLGLWVQGTTASPFSGGRYRMIAGGVSVRVQ